MIIWFSLLNDNRSICRFFLAFKNWVSIFLLFEIEFSISSLDLFSSLSTWLSWTHLIRFWIYGWLLAILNICFGSIDLRPKFGSNAGSGRRYWCKGCPAKVKVLKSNLKMTYIKDVVGSTVAWPLVILSMYIL